MITRTANRGEGEIRAKVVTFDSGRGFTSLRIQDPVEGVDFYFTGREARTLYRTLQRHFAETNRAT